jgi:ParB family chromosome partitioning protein
MAQELPKPRSSRLDLVRSGQALTGSLKIPRRGRVIVNIDAIIPDPNNERKTFHAIDDLAASIARVGVVEPPTVVPLPDDRYMLTTGERRWRAARKAGLQQIPVIVGDPEEEKVRRVKSLVSNVQREDLSVIDLAHALQEMKEDNPDIKTNRDLAAIVGKTEQWVGQMLKVLSLPEKTQEEIRSADHPVPYESVLQIARVDDSREQTKLVKKALAGATVKEIREEARQAKTSKGSRKKTTPPKKKIRVSSGWVMVQLNVPDAEQTHFVAALTEAANTLRKM